MLDVPRSQHARQLPHSLPWSGAGQVLSSGFVDTVEVHGQCFTGPWSIICELILIIKFGGITSGSIKVKNFTSLVGIQCLVPGVRLHTSKIFFKCSGLWMSPLSCHLNQGSPVISVTIASTQRGSCSASCLRVSASLTFFPFVLNLIISYSLDPVKLGRLDA